MIFTEKTNTEFYKGSGFDGEYEENVIRVITDDKDFSAGSYYEGNVTGADGRSVAVKIKVVGIFGKPMYNLRTTTAGSDISSANIVHFFEDVPRNSDYFNCIACAEDYEKALGVKLDHSINKNSLIIFDEDLTNDEMKENITFLKKHGVVATAEDIAEADAESNEYVLKTKMPIFVFLFCVSLMGMIAVSTINITKQMHTLSIYSMLGCSKKDIIKIIYVYISGICAIALCIIWIILLLSEYLDALSNYFMLVSWLNYITPMLLSVMICLLVPVFLTRVFKKQKLTDINKNN